MRKAWADMSEDERKVVIAGEKVRGDRMIAAIDKWAASDGSAAEIVGTLLQDDTILTAVES